MKSLRIPALLLASLAAVAFVQEATYNLAWRPKKGDALKYAASVSADIQGSKVEFGGELETKVTDLAENGDYTTETLYKNPKLTIDGKETPIPDTTPSEPKIEKFNAKGVRIDKDKDKDKESEEADDALGTVLGMIMDFQAPEKPVRVGDKWSHEFPKDKTHEHPAKTDFVVESSGKLGEYEVVKIKFSFGETEGDKPLKAEGAFYIAITDGALIRAEGDVENLKMAPDASPASAKVKLDRK